MLEFAREFAIVWWGENYYREQHVSLMTLRFKWIILGTDQQCEWDMVSEEDNCGKQAEKVGRVFTSQGQVT
jgi:hypothetical protein